VALNEVTLGYRLRQAVWGQGYATEGARALIRKGFTELGVQRVVATTYQDNLASRRVMEKAGLSLVRTYRMTIAELLANDTTSHSTLEELWDGDDVEYELLKADWQQQEAASGEWGASECLTLRVGVRRTCSDERQEAVICFCL
jgi:RimJ/RimL family protein N-acetyltransferase